MFFFSSRRRHTRLQGDWSSDVCSSDLHAAPPFSFAIAASSSTLARAYSSSLGTPWCHLPTSSMKLTPLRSEERRVGKSVDLGGRRIIKKKNTRTALTSNEPLSLVVSLP